MSGILDYLKWRGDLTLSQDPMNEIDMLVFAELSYCPFEKMDDAIGKKLCEISEDLARIILEAPEVSGSSTSRAELISILRPKTRYADILLEDFYCTFDPSRSEQFAVATFRLGDNAIISFRGTDATIVGIREDLNMSLERPVPGQIESTEYLNRIAQSYNNIYLCGHSKGGNLAIYSASTCNSEIRSRIRGIFNYDGPGLSAQMREYEGWKCVRQLVHSFIPESSIIGLLLSQVKDCRIVESDSVSFFQHDAFKWHVQGKQFVYASETTKSSARINRHINRFLETCDVEQREHTIQVLFEIIESTGATTMKEIPKLLVKHITDVTQTVKGLSQEDWQALKELKKFLAR